MEDNMLSGEQLDPISIASLISQLWGSLHISGQPVYNVQDKMYILTEEQLKLMLVSIGNMRSQISILSAKLDKQIPVDLFINLARSGLKMKQPGSEYFYHRIMDVLQTWMVSKNIDSTELINQLTTEYKAYVDECEHERRIDKLVDKPSQQVNMGGDYHDNSKTDEYHTHTHKY